MSYNIAIPSYNRAEVLQEKTLQMLKHYNIPASRITVFVANAEEKQKYMEACDKSLYGSLVIGHKGVMAIRNFITNYYPKDAYVISLDDDIDGFDKISDTNNPKWTPIKSFKKDMIEEGMRLMKENNYHIWGIYPNRNAGYASKMKPVSTDLKFLIGHCFGFINKKVLTHINYKEDYERSLEYAISDGGVIRFNHICAKTRFGLPGGVGKTSKERVETYHKEVEFLIKKYPSLVRKNPRRVGEILLARTVKSVSGGKAPPAVRRTDSDAENTERKVLKIRNKARYEKAKAKLLELLRITTIPKLGKPGKDGVYNRARKLGSIGRTTTFGFGDTRAGIKEYATNRNHPELFRALAEFGNTVVPLNWEYNGITLNHGVKANKHKDSKNLGPSVIIGIGDFTGGDIRVWDKDDKDPKDINLHDQPVMFNGGLLFHQTTPFKGERYTMIFYKQMWEGQPKGVKLEGGVSIKRDDFIKEHLNLLNILKIGTPAQRKKEAEDQAKELSGVLTGGIFA